MYKKKFKSKKPPKITDTIGVTPAKEAGIFYVLDEDPIQAARYLTIKHVPEHATKILESLTWQYLLHYSLFAESTLRDYYKFKPIPFIYQTPYNIMYFSTMYEELANIYKQYSRHLPAEPVKCEKDKVLYNTHIVSKYSTKQELILPDYLPLIKSRKELRKYNILGMDEPSNTAIDIFRLMYIVDGYPLEEFPCGAPSWYSPMRREVYRKYDRLSKKTFVIMVDEQGKYRYYFQYISNKLREITDLENIRPLIDSFLYKV